MHRLIVGVAVALVALGLFGGTAFADNGPHGGYTATTDACAGCHRAHTAVGPKLLVASTTYDLCMTCHGAAGTGANTNVLDGVYANRAVPARSEGTANGGLLGGGFANARMATDGGTTSASGATTSTHNVNGTAAGTVWGFGAISATANTGASGVAMDCTSCHDPHGKASSTGLPTYRILRDQPHGALGGAAFSASTLADVGGVSALPDPVTKTYTVGAASYFGQDYGTLGTSLASWCSTCHQRYMAQTADAETSSGDAVYTYRHVSSGVGGPNCLSCHVAHGSASHMSGYADSAGGQPGNTSATDSALLRLDNRGVCQGCHHK
jgi:predicted CXXCH cytochrome family protein